MKNLAIAMAGLASISATPALAETTYLSFGLSYSELDDGFDTLKTTAISGAYEGTTEKFTYGAEMSTAQIDIDNLNADVTNVSAFVGYDVTSEFTVFGKVGFADTAGLKSSELTAGAEFSTGVFTFGGNYTLTDLDVEDSDYGNLFAVYDTGNFEAYAAVALYEGLDLTFLGLSRDVGTYEIGFDAILSDIVDFYSLSGSYNIRENIRVNASLSTFDIGFGFDVSIDEKAIGFGYMVADNVWVDATYSSIDLEGASADGFGLEISFEKGKNTLKSLEYSPSIYNLYDSTPFLSIGG